MPAQQRTDCNKVPRPDSRGGGRRECFKRGQREGHASAAQKVTTVEITIHTSLSLASHYVQMDLAGMKRL